MYERVCYSYLLCGLFTTSYIAAGYPHWHHPKIWIKSTLYATIWPYCWWKKYTQDDSGLIFFNLEKDNNPLSIKAHERYKMLCETDD